MVLSKLFNKPNKNKLKNFFKLLRIIITIFLLYIIFKKINFSNTVKIVQSSNIFYFMLSAILVFFFNLFSVYRWRFSLYQNSVYIKYSTLLRFHLISIFAQNFLPASIGGDVVKSILAFRGNPKIRVASSILISRISGIFALGILVNFSLFFLSENGGIIYKLKWVSLSVFFMFILLYIVIFNRKIQELVIKIYNSINIKKLKKLEINVFFEKINSYRKIKILTFLILFSFIIQIFPILSNYFLFYSIHSPLNISYFFVYTPLITFISILPISLNGLGIREGLYYYFFRNLVSSDNIIFAFILLSLLIRMIFTLIGGLLLIFKIEK